MDHYRLRSVLLKLDNRLSSEDRQRFHFFLGDDVPRRVRDDATLHGTLAVIDCLFDQDKINERDFTYLIDAFEEIECFNAAHLLREYQQELQLQGLNQSARSLGSILLPKTRQILPDLLDDQERDNAIEETDEITLNKFICETASWNSDQEVNATPSYKTKNCRPSSLPWTYIFVSLFMFTSLIAVGTLTSILIWKINQISLYEEKLNTLYNQNQFTSKKLGKTFGGNHGGSFDDSLTDKFTFYHYLNGMQGTQHGEVLSYIRFSYSSLQNENHTIVSPLHGFNDFSKQSQIFMLTKDERIIAVHVYVNKHTEVVNDPSNDLNIITGLQFFTTSGRSSPIFGEAFGERFVEEFNGAALGYATGKYGPSLNQLQFVWYQA
ncbi:unnamed protein product [Adineta ricciae]|uniref:Uncharacterized protein n=1 Tax=Adineta ricciae TaxID=249248 RepID=A0A815FFT7_ADIRI|nr:unnamed protein product [Adineta ricciae]CAF1324652.1 unnamed protein product [Adineta ricciae]